MDLGLADVDDEPLALDVGGADADGLVEAQSALVDQRAVGAETDVVEGAQQPVDLVAGEDLGQRFVALDVDLLADVPPDAEVVAVEGAQGADGMVDGAGPQPAPILEVDEEVEDTLGSELGKIVLRIVIGKLMDPAVIGLATALGEAFELDKTGEVLIPLE